jgi:hypothetical protein
MLEKFLELNEKDETAQPTQLCGPARQIWLRPWLKPAHWPFTRQREYGRARRSRPHRVHRTAPPLSETDRRHPPFRSCPQFRCALIAPALSSVWPGLRQSKDAFILNFAPSPSAHLCSFAYRAPHQPPLASPCLSSPSLSALAKSSSRCPVREGSQPHRHAP